MIRVFEATRTGARLADVGYLPEERGLYRKMKVRDLLLFFSELRTGRREADDVDRWLSAFELTSWGASTVESLSKGMSQKVQFIAAVVAGPRLVVMDEPFSGLDPVNFDVMKSAVLGLRDKGTTVVLSTHDMALAESLCEYLCMIHKGAKVLDGTPQDIRRAHGSDVVRLTTAGPSPIPARLAGAASVRGRGSEFEIVLEPGADPQRLLAQLVTMVGILRFEVSRPTLHDIFVRIVRQDEGGPDNA
jgi:ABC-2 type transport system ATP-binding protein